MVSLRKARELLGDSCQMTDDEIEAMLAQFLRIADVAIDSVEMPELTEEPE